MPVKKKIEYGFLFRPRNSGTLASLVEFKEKMILLNMCFPLGMGYIYHG